MNATQTADPVRNDVLRDAARANLVFTDLAELDDLVRELQKLLG